MFLVAKQVATGLVSIISVVIDQTNLIAMVNLNLYGDIIFLNMISRLNFVLFVCKGPYFICEVFDE